MSRAPRRSRPVARLLALATMLLMALGWAAAGGPAAAQATATGNPRLTLVRQTDWVGPEAVFQVTVRGEDLPAGATIGGRLHPRVNDRTTLEDAAAGRATDRIFDVPPKPVTELTGPDGNITISLPVTTSTSAPMGVASLANAGVYPFTVRVFADAAGTEEVANLVTTLLRLGDVTPGSSASRLAVGVVVPVEAPATPDDDGSPTFTDDASTHLLDTLDAVAASPELPLTVAPSPESLQLLEASSPSGQAAVAELEATVSRQVLTGPYAPVDAGSFLASGLGPELDDQYSSGTITLQALLGTRPSEQAALLDRTVSPEVVARLRDLGVDRLVVPSDQLTSFSAANSTFAEQFDLATGEGVTTPAVVADQPTATRLAADADPVLAGHQALAELAYLSLAQSSATPARGVAVVVPSASDPAALRTFLDGLEGLDGAASGSIGEPMLSPVTIDQLFTATARPTDSRTSTPIRGYQADDPRPLGSYAGELRAAGTSLDGLRSLAPSAPEVTTPLARNLLSSGARALSPEERELMVTTTAETISGITHEIVVTPEQIVTLTSASGKVPLNLENRLQYPVTVRISLSSAKLDFPEGAVITETLAAAQTTTINVQVETRASGAFPLTADITSPDGSLAVATTRYTVRSTAISGVGLVLSVGAGLFLLVWWGRHFRTTRRARKLVASNHPALSPNDPAGYAPADTDPLEGR